MYGSVDLVGGHARGKALAVPDSAVLDSGTRQVVLVQRGEGLFEPRSVKLGMRADGYVEVLDGVAAGESVVVRANFLIDAESNLKAALETFGGHGGHGAAPKPEGAKAAPAHRGRGTVESLDPQAGSIEINHGPIATLKWPAMTMEFKVRDKAQLAASPRARWWSSSSRMRTSSSALPRRPRTRGTGDSAMLNRIIEWSARSAFLVLLATAFVVAWGVYAVIKTPVDAIPDLSDVQVIIYTEYPGQAPQVVEDQVTYPLTTAMLAVPKSKVVRGAVGVRRFLRLHHFRGRHRHLLGALARARVPELRIRPAAARGDGLARPGCDRRGLGISSTRCSPRTGRWRSCARSRTGSCAISSPKRRASPRSRASAASSSSTR